MAILLNYLKNLGQNISKYFKNDCYYKCLSKYVLELDLVNNKYYKFLCPKYSSL